MKISTDELADRAFRLAYFLHRERETAIAIAGRALNKLRLAATAQGKRLYYRLTGRADRKARSKVSMEEPHLLQRLVYVESEEFERRKESAALDPQPDNKMKPARHSDLVVFFIKHLVRITTKRNSFYVTLGLGRLLYNYTTPETMELYNLIIQDPDRVHDDYYYRSRKGVLLKELKERFGSLVDVVKGVRGEQRWRTGELNAQHAALVRECLVWFTPWSTPCVVPERFDPLSDSIEKLTFAGRHPDEEHEVEVNRIHAALHPDCFARLAAANGLPAPDERLELPHFFLTDANDDTDQNSRTPPNLSEEELNTINDLLAQEASRRKAASSGFLRVLVDGNEVAEINPERSASANFAIDESAEVIEVYGSDEQGSLLLATHLLEFNGRQSQNLAITVEGGQRIAFTVNLLRVENGSPSGARITVAFAETAAAPTFGRLWTSVVGALPGLAAPSGWWKPAAAFTALALLVAAGWFVWTIRKDQTSFVRVTPTPAPAITAPSPLAPTGKEPPRPEPPENKMPTNRNESSTPLLARHESFVERSLVPNTSSDSDPAEVGTRGAWNRDLMGKPLAEVRRVHFQITDAAKANLLTQLQTRLAGSSSLQVSDVEQADAALKISVRRASSRSDDERVVVIVRAVNANGYVIWPASRRSSSWRYIGRVNYVAERLVVDLNRDIESAKQR